MKRYHPVFLLALIFLCTLTAIQAQETSEDFRRQTQAWIDEGNLAQIAWSVRYHRKEAKDAFYQALPKQIAQPTAQDERWLNTIARALRLEGMDRPNRALRDAGYLWPLTRWRGTMYEAEGPMGEYDIHGSWD
jgi:hypothetical protein